MNAAEEDLHDLASGALVVILGKAARISRGGFIWVITLLCGLEVQGLYSLAWAVCTTLNKLARFGLPRGVVFFVAAERVDEDDGGGGKAIAVGALLATIVSAVVVAGLHLSADRLALFYDRPIATALRIMSWTAPFVALTWVLTSATRALRIVRYDVYVRSIAGPLVLFAGGTAVGLAGLGLEAIACVQLLMAGGNLAFAAYLFKRHFPLAATIRRAAAVPRWRPMARFCAPVAFTDLVYGLVVQLDVLMLGWFVDMSLVGIYVLVRRLASALLKAPQAFDAMFSTVVSDLTARGRDDELGNRYVTVTRWILTVNLPVIVCLLVIGGPALQLLDASRLAEVAHAELALRVLFILGLGMMVQSVFFVAEPLLAMSGRPGLNLVNNLVWLAANFGLNLWLIDAYGIAGAALGAALAMVLVNLLRLVEVHIFRGVLPFSPAQLKPLVAAAAAALPAWWLLDATPGKVWPAVLPASAFLLTYFLGLLLLRPEPEDRAMLSALWRRLRR
ncbi:MAG TPA: polysaccharide biosynthesis C-terminal domain-containing protein [Candidatus Latescibacteria bacterium]|nr:polysaccharide biosynthesis C-terminal domain-containing protein [Candidatus Latescibacterota bacterium]HJP29473.1 polysaccharide biosynthesis C-terminal domain-containing protein [Candidatus Latescibacterota bacterium]